MSSRDRILIALFFTLTLPVLAMATPTQLLALSPDAVGADARVTVKHQNSEGMTLELTLDGLDRERIMLDGRTFDRLDISDGGVVGAEGQAALPSFTRLVALPAGSGVTARVLDATTQSLGTMNITPVQPIIESGKVAPSFDASWYTRAPIAEPGVSVGEPALMHGLRVVPVTFRPVSYDAITGEVTVATSMTVDITFAGSDSRNDKSSGSRMVSESFALMFEQEVLGYDRDADTQVGPGRYIMVCPNNSTVTTIVDKLADWRRRQGYTVQVVTTATTGTSATAIKTWLAGQYAVSNPPLEFVTIVGDANGSVAIPTFHESYSGYWGEGDHEYSTLEGGDVLADVHVGRLSVTSTSQLQIVVDKIVDYESAPDMSQTNWFTTAGLTGDPSDSGYSTIWVNQFVKEQLLDLNYTRIDTIWSGNFVTQMTATINQGESIFTYRGYWWMSGMNASHITGLGNGQQLPYAVILTCDTGSFEDDTTCRSEAFLRASNGGGIASIGTATLGTHTRYNNCMFLGNMNGVLKSGDQRVGPSLTRGKLNLYKNYFENEWEKVWTWSTWNNLMGDPATEIWTGVPCAIAVDYPASVALGSNALPVTVTMGGFPLAGARVALYQEDHVAEFAYTDATGNVLLPIDGAVSGDVLVTVTGTNLHPHLGETAVGTVVRSLDFDLLTINEVSGNGDDLANPGELLDLQIRVRNHGTSSVSAATGLLSSALDYLSIIDGSAAFGTVAAGGTATGTFRVQVETDAPGGEVPELRLDASGSGGTWSSIVALPVHGPWGSFNRLTFGGPGGDLDPGESGTVNFNLANVGNMNTAGITATMSCASQWITVTDANGSWGPISSSSASGQSNTFAIAIGTECLTGHVASLVVDLVFAEGGTETLVYPVTVGTAAAGDPTGPDIYGYYAFDNNDTAPEAPTYQWVELAGVGFNTGISDNSRHDDETRNFDLPFPFTYYGQTYDRVSICSNGWLSFGDTYIKLYRNWTLPADGSPDAMVAAFWDDLAQGTVYRWYDSANHRYIVQWDDFGTFNGYYSYTGNCTFEIILYDPAFHETDTGDGLIVMQYQAVTVYGDETTYFTTGIQDHTRTVGLTYAYGNDYPASSATVAANRAIAFLPVVLVPDITDTPSADMRLALGQNQPNPFNPQTTITFNLPRTQDASLRIYDLQGHLVRTLVQGRFAVGQHSVTWKGRDDAGTSVASGMYFYRLVTADGTEVRKMSLLK